VRIRIVRVLAIAAAAAAILFLAATAAMRQPLLLQLQTYRGSGNADAAVLRQHVDYLTSGPRGDRAASYIAASFRASGATVRDQHFVARGNEYRNVIATFGPADERRPLLIVGAHYDAFNDLPGADDNASGVAGLLELARLLGRDSMKSPVMLVAYANEEPPFFGSEQMGSAVHAASVGGRNVTGMICLEMIGYYAPSQAWSSWVLDAMYPNRGDFIAVAGGWSDRALARRVKAAMIAARGIDVVSFSGPRAMLDASDHRNYWARGWPAVMITDTAYLRNPNYHTRSDTPATLDYRRMAAVVDGVYNAVLHLAPTR
jgi:Zn-dependent M28 family amino/carboxypeptidase